MKTAVLALALTLSLTLTHAEQTNAAHPTVPGGDSQGLIRPVVTMRPVTYADRYCSGFITRQELPTATVISANLNSPHATKLGKGEVVYVTGPNLQVGALYSILREMRDSNHTELFSGQHRLLRQTGQFYADLGRVRVLDTRQKMAVGVVEFSCKAIVPGDLLVPFAERPEITIRPPAPLDRFAPANGALTGQIVMAGDFEFLLGVGKKVYLNIGSERKIKPGDIFRVYRTPKEELRDEVDSLSYKSTILEDSQKHPARIRTGGLSLDPEFFDLGSGPKIRATDLPRRILGEIIVLHVTPTSSTGMITVALEDIHPGDGVEAEGATVAEK